MSSAKEQPDLGMFIRTICGDAVARVGHVLRRVENAMAFAFSLLPRALAQDPLYNLAPPNTTLFTATAINPDSTEGPIPPSIQEDINQLSGPFSLSAWDLRGDAIRSGSDTAQCLGNLSIALRSFGSLEAADFSGAAGALSLLPTAGALIGSPTKELWVVYKLMPLAGVLSMLLSLGGSMVPTQAGAYDPKMPFTYGGMIATSNSSEQARRQLDDELEEKEVLDPNEKTAERIFSRRVLRRANETRGGTYWKVWWGFGIQLSLVIIITMVLWYGQRGGVIIWWCKGWGWMWVWFLVVAIASILENSAGVPFTDNWTMRVSKAPQGLLISGGAPIAVPGPGDNNQDPRDVLARLKSGYNIKSMISIENTTLPVTNNKCFYVIISKDGVSRLHAVGRVISKGVSVTVFAFGTSLFASATLMPVATATMVLATVLAAGVWGRVTAMWIAAEMNKETDPVLHTVVSQREDAAKHLEEILKLDGLVIETCGHIIVNNRIICRKNKWLTWSRYIGLLAAPFDIMKMARNSHVSLAGRPVRTAGRSESSTSESFTQHLLLTRSNSDSVV